MATETRKHRWRFQLAGGFDQVKLDTAEDLLALPGLDQKLWVALACPVDGLEFDHKTLELLDTDKDGRVSHRFEPQMKLELFLKDFRLMLEEAQRLGVALPLTSLTQQLCTAAVAAGRGGDDLAVLITTLETMAGLGPA